MIAQRRSRFAFSLLPVIFAAAASMACGESSDSSLSGSRASETPGQNAGNNNNNGNDNNSSNNENNGNAERAIAEADIVQLQGGRLFAMSKSGTLSIVDVSVAGRLTMLGQAFLPGEPFEMYLRGDLLFVMTNGAFNRTGSVQERQQQQPQQGTRNGNGGAPSSSQGEAPSQLPDPTTGAAVIVINVKDAGLMQRVTTFAVAGEIADSRVVGDILYLVTYQNASCWQCGSAQGTLVTSFDITNASSLRQVDQRQFLSGSAAGWNLMAWKRSVMATSERLYVGGHTDSAPNFSGTNDEGEIDVIDITDPGGKLGKGAHITTVGAITSRWQMDANNETLRIITQRGNGYMRNGVGDPQVQTFHIWNTNSMQPMGKTNIKMPRQEELKTVRFDGDRAYAITFAETDPLFVIDLTDEAQPKQRGEIHMPGWVFHLEPHGNRLLGLGLDRRNSSGHLNVSLFDVEDMDNPSMIQRVDFGATGGITSDQAIVSYELPEDQDRIQKAFRVLDNNLIVVPFSGSQAFGSGACMTGGGVQLISWEQDSLVSHGALPMAGNPRRALKNPSSNEILAVSDSNVSAFNVAARWNPTLTADLVIGACEARTTSVGGVSNIGSRGGEAREFNDSFESEGNGMWMCSSSSTSRTGLGLAGKSASWMTVVALGAVVAGVVRRRRSRASEKA